VRRIATLASVAFTGGVALAACASSSGAGRADDCTSELRRDGRPLSDMLDSTALSRELASMWDASAGLTLATVAYDSVGARDTASVMSMHGSPAERDRWAGVVGRLAPVNAFPRQSLRLVIGDENGLALRRVSTFAGCPPSLRNREVMVGAIENEASTLQLVGPTTVQLYVLVGEDGLVREIRVNRSSSNIEADAAATRVMRTATFEPGRVEGIPVSLWVSFPVTFVRAPRRDR